MFDKDTLIALQEGQSIASAAAALANSALTKDSAALPSDYKLHDLEKLLPLRRRARGTMSTDVLASFTSYTKTHAEPGASVFIDAMNMSATAVLNLGTPDAPGQADNKAGLKLKRTAAYSALLPVASGVGHKQSIIAEFLEDWPDFIKCFSESEQISPPKAIAAIRKLSIETMRKLESSEQQLSVSKSAFESVQATSKDPLPTTIYFECQPYTELRSRQFVLRLGVQTGGDKPAITLRVVKAEQHNEEMATELALLIAEKFTGENPIPVLLGAYSKSE